MGIACGALPWRLNMHKLNSYFGMAENDYLYAKGGMETCRRLGNYNGVASGCAQAAEKYLKALAERCLVDDPEAVTLLKTHNLRSLVNKLKEQIPGIPLDSRDCKWLGDFYFDARYPGDNFVTVNEEDALECLRDYSGSPAHPGRSSAQPDRASAHLIRSAVQLMPVADQHTC